MFHSQSFESLLNDAVPKTPAYRTAMIDNTVGAIWRWISRDAEQNESGTPPTEQSIADKLKPVLEELLVAHEMDCRRRRLANAPRWALHRASILLRFVFFDALGPSLIAIFVIALLVGWIDSVWFLASIRKLAG